MVKVITSPEKVKKGIEQIELVTAVVSESSRILNTQLDATNGKKNPLPLDVTRQSLAPLGPDYEAITSTTDPTCLVIGPGVVNTPEERANGVPARNCNTVLGWRKCSAGIRDGPVTVSRTDGPYSASRQL